MQSLGDVSFAVPDGWTYKRGPDFGAVVKTSGQNYWLMAVYTPMASTGDPTSDVKAAWTLAPDEAEQVLLSDPFDLRYDVVGGEGCWTAIGHTNDVRVLIVVWTVREEERIRVITARAAGKSARATYLRERGF